MPAATPKSYSTKESSSAAWLSISREIRVVATSGFGKLLADLNRAEIGYVVIGGIAVIRHGVVRATRDVDVMLAPTEGSRAALRDLVDDWGATRQDGTPLGARDLVPGRNVHLATPHGLLDVLAEQSPPLTFEEVASRAEERRVDGTPAPICSLGDLVALKRLAGRPRDEVDLADLETAHGPLPDSRDRT